VKLFVYGTLKPGRSSILHARSLGVARVRGRLYDCGAYPGAVLDPAAPDFVHGEVVEAGDDAALLAALDDYEGAEFRREPIAVLTDDGRRHDCWIYVLAREPAALDAIASGRWDPPDS
jgi:gamma-glutamylcyclotransferase (GGCT)/AIG2-like uncharacterized protein YtfP